MLPFLKRDKEASVSGPVESKQMNTHPDDELDLDYDSMESAMEDLANALATKNYKAAAEAFRAAFDLLETQPHDEYEGNE